MNLRLMPACSPRILVAACLVLALSACGRSITSTPGDAPNLEKWTVDVRARPAPPPPKAKNRFPAARAFACARAPPFLAFTAV